MKNNSAPGLGLLSLLLFLISALLYLVPTFIVGDLFSGPIIITSAIVLPIIGLIFGFKGSNGAYTRLGIVGNLLVLLIAGIIPTISTIF